MLTRLKTCTHMCAHAHTHTHACMHTHTHTHYAHSTKSMAQGEHNQCPWNLLFYRDCLATCFGLHGSRIQLQWQKEQPIVEMSKEEVEEKKLVDYVLRDDEDGEMMTFATW